MSQVPTANIAAFYANTATGVKASSIKIDAAIADIVNTINVNDTALANYQAGTRYNADGGAYTDTAFVNTIDGGTY